MHSVRRYCQWRKEGLQELDGIVVGSDISQEWLLPWWWDNIRKHNDHPVTFVDFGLSEVKKKWCRERGELISLPLFDFLIKDKEEISLTIADKWEGRYGENFWQYRKAWFKKPAACLQSPYRRTVWLDLDCEVLGSLDKLFEASDHSSGFAIVKDREAPSSSFPIYNSGVIAFRRNLPLMNHWAEQSFANNGEFRGDQDLLSEIIQNIPICELPCIYNWHVGYGMNPDAVICHWIGDLGKQMLRDQILLQQFSSTS